MATRLALSEAERTISLKQVDGAVLRKDTPVEFASQTIPSAATLVWVFVDRTNILGTKTRVHVRFEFSLDGGQTWGGLLVIKPQDKSIEPIREFYLNLEDWIDGVDNTPAGLSKDWGFGIYLPPELGAPRLIRSIVKTTDDVDIGVYFKFDDPPPAFTPKVR
jgi:hypothetical protein